MTFSRREFLSTSAAAASAAALGLNWASTSFAQKDTADIRVATIGFNGQGGAHIQRLGKNIVALCDADEKVLDVVRDDFRIRFNSQTWGGMIGASQVLAGKQITTIEGLETNGQLHPLQQSFIEADAMQCCYCTAGMIMTGAALLKKNPKPSRDEIVKAMDRNVCRCGTYLRIVKAIEMASGLAKEVRK